MSGDRAPQAGVTLIEMLVAIAISALIGLAGFALLESMTRTEAGTAGRLDRLALQDRAFQLFTLDVETADSAVFQDALVLRLSDALVTWSASSDGVVRRIDTPNRPLIEQHILQEPATLGRRGPGIVVLKLTDASVWKLARLPEGFGQ